MYVESSVATAITFAVTANASQTGNLQEWQDSSFNALSLIDENGFLGIGDTSPASALTVGNGDLFQVNSSGNIVRINNITYSWPSAQAGGSNYALANNGSGILSWMDTSGFGTVYTAGNDIDFSGAGSDVIDIEPILNFVTSITRDSGNLSLGTTTSGNLVLAPVGNISSSADIIPSLYGTYALGSSSYRLKELYLSETYGLHIGSATNESFVSFNATSNLLTLQNNVDSTSGFQFLDADGGVPIVSIDTTNERVGIGDATPDSVLDISNVGFLASSTWDIGQEITVLKSGSSASYNGIRGLDISSTSTATGVGIAEAYGIGINTYSGNDADVQYIYGVKSDIQVHSGDYGYAFRVADDNSSTGGTAYGVYIDLDDTDLTRYGIYQTSANDNYFAGKIGIGTASPDYALDVAGTAGFDDYLYHNGDADTSIIFTDDQVEIQAGGRRMITFDEGVSSIVTGNLNSHDIDFAWHGDTNTNLFRIDAGAELIGIGGAPANFKLDVTGSIGPSADDTYDLGSATYRWRDLYLGPASIHMGVTGDESIITFNTTTNAIEFDANGNASSDFTVTAGGGLTTGFGQGILSSSSGGVLSSTDPSCGAGQYITYSGGTISCSAPPVNPGLTTGSIAFQGVSGLDEDNSNLFWNDTNDLLEVGTSGSSIDAQIYAYNNTSPTGTTSYGIYNHQEINSAAASSTNYGIKNEITINTTSTHTTSIRGASNSVYLLNTGTLNSLVGSENSAGMTSVAGTVSSVMGSTHSVAGGSGTITNGYGLTVGVAGGTITNGYGIYMTDIDATNQYGIYQAGSDDINYFAGEIRVGANTSGAKVVVTPGTGESGINILSPDAGNSHIAYNGSDNYFSYANTGKTVFRSFTTGPTYVTQMQIDGATGNVGIGSATPSELLHVSSTTTDTTMVLSTSASSVDSGIALKTATATPSTYWNIFVDESDSQKLRFAIGDTVNTGTDVLTLLKSGKIGIGTNAPDAQLQIVGSIGTTSGSGNLYHWTDVAHYSDGGNPTTGTLKIVLPQSWTNTMMKIEIEGYAYEASNGAWTATVSGYNYSGSSTWVNTDAEITGKAPFTSVRLAHDGTTSTTWYYPKIVVTNVTTGHSNYTDWGDSWSMSIISSETGITNINTPSAIPSFNVGVTGSTAPFTVDSTYKVTSLNADLLDGADTSVAASNSTIVQRHASGYIYANYLNTTANATATAASHFAVQTGSDNFIRWQTPANARNSLGLGTADNVTFGDVTVSGSNLYIGDDGEILDSGTNFISTPDSFAVRTSTAIGYLTVAQNSNINGGGPGTTPQWSNSALFLGNTTYGMGFDVDQIDTVGGELRFNYNSTEDVSIAAGGGKVYLDNIDMSLDYPSDEVNAGRIIYRPSFDTAALGIIGASTTAGSRKVHIWDDVTIDDQLSVGGWAVASGTNVCRNGNTLSLCSSSIRYKENIVDLSIANLNVVSKLRPVKFDWIGRDEIDIGFIAEEVEQVSPLLVEYKDGIVEGVKYSQLTAVLTGAIQQQYSLYTLLQQNVSDINEITINNPIFTQMLKDYDDGLLAGDGQWQSSSTKLSTSKGVTASGFNGGASTFTSILGSSLTIGSGAFKVSSVGNVTVAGDILLSGRILGGPDGIVNIEADLTAFQITAKKYNVDTADVAAASAGQAIIPVLLTEIEIETTSVTPDSLIFVTPTVDLAGATLYVDTKDDGSFVVKVSTPQLVDVTFDWWVIN